MFIIFGDKHRTQDVPDGLRLERKCPSCGAVATFRERRVSKEFQLYFVGMFTHGTHHVLQCGACAETFVTDELPKRGIAADHAGTVLGHVQGLVDKGRALASDPRVAASAQRVGTDAAKALDTAQQEASKALDAAEKTVSAWVSSWKKRRDS